MVLDRLFLWIFTIACLGGTCGIILQVRDKNDSHSSCLQNYSLLRYHECLIFHFLFCYSCFRFRLLLFTTKDNPLMHRCQGLDSNFFVAKLLRKPLDAFLHFYQLEKKILESVTFCFFQERQVSTQDVSTPVDLHTKSHTHFFNAK